MAQGTNDLTAESSTSHTHEGLYTPAKRTLNMKEIIYESKTDNNYNIIIISFKHKGHDYYVLVIINTSTGHIERSRGFRWSTLSKGNSLSSGHLDFFSRAAKSVYKDYIGILKSAIHNKKIRYEVQRILKKGQVLSLTLIKTAWATLVGVMGMYGWAIGWEWDAGQRVQVGEYHSEEQRKDRMNTLIRKIEEISEKLGQNTFNVDEFFTKFFNKLIELSNINNIGIDIDIDVNAIINEINKGNKMAGLAEIRVPQEATAPTVDTPAPPVDTPAPASPPLPTSAAAPRRFQLQVAPSRPLVVVGGFLKEFNASTLEEVLEKVREQLGYTAWQVEIARADLFANRGEAIETMDELMEVAPFTRGAHRAKIQVWIVGLDPKITKPPALSDEIFEQLVATAARVGFGFTPEILHTFTEETAKRVIETYKGVDWVAGWTPAMRGGYRDPPKRKKRKSRKNTKRKNIRRKSNKRKNTKRKITKRKITKRKITKRKITKRKKRKSSKRE